MHARNRLPIAPLLDDIGRAVRTTPVTIVCGATGSGKSTQIPQLLLRELPEQRIGHTQPRRLAARAVAVRIAQECGSPPGALVGFQTRFEQAVSTETRLKVMTDGILLQEITRDPELHAYGALVIDEIHERSLNIDFLLGYLRKLLPRRPALRLVLMSATLEADRFRDFFGQAEVVAIPGATYPVDVRYRPLEAAADGSGLYDGIVAALAELDAEDRGDVLVFLPGEREIAEAAEQLRAAALDGTEVLPLYARLAYAEQQRVFQPHTARHVVLATNVAETSVTVPGVRHVIDSGLARLGQYSPRTKLQRLTVGRIAQASADQRRGRCGRERPGICIRLYSEEQFARSPRYTQPELLRTNLAAVILRLADLGLGRIEDFPLLDAPGGAAINDGYLLLRELGALDGERRLLRTGRRLARLPVDPRLARMLLAGHEFDCLREMLVIVSALSAGDVRERPHEARQAADLAHQRFRDHRSDFLWYLNAWEAAREALLPLSRRQQQAWCMREHWSWRRWREWLDIHRDLTARVGEMSLRINPGAASYRAVHQALLSGLATRIARWEEKSDYVGCRQRRMRLHPSSALRAKPPRWVVAAEITETTQTYARTVARIDPKWAAHAAGTLLRRSYSPPGWDVTRGEAFVLEEQALFGLVLSSGRRVGLQALDPAQAREVFIRQALVGGQLGAEAAFLSHNEALVSRVRAAEARARRRDLLAEEDALCAFYAAVLPDDIVTRRQLLAWLREDPAREAALHMPEHVVTRSGIDAVTDYLYPDALACGDLRLPLMYRYAPGDEDDGVTVSVPLAVLTSVPRGAFERLVPGLLAEKISALLRGLPKERRRFLSPLAEFAQAFTAAIENVPGPLVEALSVAARRITGLGIAAAEWRFDGLAPHLRMRVRLLDAEGGEIAVTRDLEAWLDGKREDVNGAFAKLPWGVPAEVGQDWVFGVLPRMIVHEVAGIAVRAYPALAVRADGIGVEIVEKEALAEERHRSGLIALLELTLPREVKSVRRDLAGLAALELQALRLGLERRLADELLRAGFERALAGHELPRDAATFATLRAIVAGQLAVGVRDAAQQAAALLAAATTGVGRALPEVEARWPVVAEELRAQLRELFVEGFLWRRATELVHYPRYLRAMELRIERLHENPAKDLQRRDAFAALLVQCVDAAPRLARADAARLAYLLEEFRVSLFAPTLRTAEKVSAQRIEDFLAGAEGRSA